MTNIEKYFKIIKTSVMETPEYAFFQDLKRKLLGQSKIINVDSSLSSNSLEQIVINDNCNAKYLDILDNGIKPLNYCVLPIKNTVCQDRIHSGINGNPIYFCGNKKMINEYNSSKNI